MDYGRLQLVWDMHLLRHRGQPVRIAQFNLDIHLVPCFAEHHVVEVGAG